MSVAPHSRFHLDSEGTREGLGRAEGGFGQSRCAWSDLTPPHVELFRRQGYLRLPGVFALEEMGWLCNEARILGLRPRAFACAGPEKIGCAEAPAAGINDPHRREPGFRNLARHPRLLRPARRLLGGQVYVSGTRLWPVHGVLPDDGWQPSVEYRRRRDRLHLPDALLAVVFLDDGPDQAGTIRLVPGSHRRDGAGSGAAAGHHGGAREEDLPIVATRGSVLFIHSSLLHRFDDPRRRRMPPMFFAKLDAVSSAAEGLPPQAGTGQLIVPAVEANDDCLWPPPYCVAG